MRDRVQLTSTGGVSRPTISADGKTIAYVVSTCGTEGCRYAIEVRDVAGGPARRIVENASAVYSVRISPDRRNVLFLGSINGRFGSHLVSILGGEPRFTVPGYANFYANGDSLVFSRIAHHGDAWMYISDIDGTLADSVQLQAKTEIPAIFGAVPGSSRIVYAVQRRSTLEVGIVERDGTMVSSLAIPGVEDGGASAASDAVWVYAESPTRSDAQIIRVPLDAGGKLAQRGDTVYSGGSTGMSVTADGGTLVYDEGATDLSGWALSVDDIVKNRFTDDKRVTRATGPIQGAISPDGKIVVVGRESPRGREFSVMPFGSTAGVPVPGVHKTAVPFDSATLKLVDVTDSGTVLSMLDYRRGIRSATRFLKSGIDDATRSGKDTWAWIPSGGSVIKVQSDDEARPREIKLSKWYKNVFWVSGDAGGSSLVVIGFQAPSEDSLGVALVSLVDGHFTQLFSTFAEGGGAWLLDDGSVAVLLNDTPDSETLYRVTPGRAPVRIGSTPRPVLSVMTVSSDLKRAFVVTQDDRRDVWMSKVVR